MRILQAHSRHAARGGADNVMDVERDLLVAAGHEVEQYVAQAAGSAAAPAWKQATDAVWNKDSYDAVRRAIVDFRPDVLHVHTPFPGLSPAVFRAAEAEGVPSVTTLHSYRYSCIAGTLRRDGRICEDCVGTTLKTPGLQHGCYHGRAASAAMTTSLVVHRRTFTQTVGRFLALTEFSKSILVRDGIPADHVTVKPNCVSNPGEPVPYDEREPVVLFVGRLVEEKGVATLLAAWALLGGSALGCRLVVVGDGPLRPMVEEAAAADPTIKCLGWQDPADVAERQAVARATVVPSEWYEGQPLVLLDALATGTPLVVSDLDNLCRSVQENNAGLTFRTGDAASLAAALTTMLASPDAAASMARAARALYLREHTPTATVQALERIYADVIAEARP